MTDGAAPRLMDPEPFLGQRVRQKLGLETNERRHADAVYVMRAVLASRPGVRLIAGRRSAQHDPRLPSRLLLACDAEELARRIQTFFGSTGEVSAPAHPLRAGRSTTAFVVPRPDFALDGPYEPLRRLNVTAFRDYLACPYRFYLKHVRKLRKVPKPAEEMDGGAFGDLAHLVLEDFGREAAVKDETNADHIRDYLRTKLGERVRLRLGGRPLPAASLQVRHLELRFDAFAQWQAAWAAQGWRIEHVELKFDEENAPFPARELSDGGDPLLYLQGRIDRIDCHPERDAWTIFDYKTYDDHKRVPTKTHRDGEEWIDLQLPLYRHLVATKGIVQSLQLGYILLPRDVSEVKESLADWGPGELRAADDAAKDVVRRIQNGEFWPMKQP
ncbi:MAG: PD-(D/E)XK nuclease family protein, partial [Planctomycetia bacterium]